ncbi:hypothetical protein CDD81_7591 [Ophiocordyceps australis]|uniref:Secreted protein n=1 Tax=Ophiocordyceps australis TaxID=1399860 RepID=A0A2C5XGT3_9HYPO|nr:hypothetical protein CDD81_7591 [Ophiocordyceps australis]
MKATLVDMVGLVALVAAGPLSGQQFNRRGGRPDSDKIPPSGAQAIAQPARRPTFLDIPPRIGLQDPMGPRVLREGENPFKFPNRGSNAPTHSLPRQGQ